MPLWKAIFSRLGENNASKETHKTLGEEINPSMKKLSLRVWDANYLGVGCQITKRAYANDIIVNPLTAFLPVILTHGKTSSLFNQFTQIRNF